jgi:hypothetical protein
MPCAGVFALSIGSSANSMSMGFPVNGKGESPLSAYQLWRVMITH